MTQRPVILCAGSLHHDVIVDAPALPRLDQTLAGSAARMALGGKGGNQAAAAARAGAEVHMAAAVGSDDAAMAMRQGLDAAGVHRERVQTHPGPSGMSVAIALPDGSHGMVVVPGANLLFRAEAVAFPRACATLLLQNEIPEPANLLLARRAREAGVRVVLNAAPARPVSADLLTTLDLLVVNRGAAAHLLARPETGLDPARAALDLLAMGPQAVIVTQGAEGLTLGEDRTATHQPARRVTPVSTRGAGDAFLGALVAEWSRGLPLARAAAFGQAAAALHVSLPPDQRAQVDEAAIRASLSA